MNDTITAVPGLSVGHYTDTLGGTGCTVVLTPQGALCGLHVGGASPGTREVGLLEHGVLVSQVHAVMLTGGSAFGLGAANGVMEWLKERGIGFEITVPVPIVPCAVLFDLATASPAYPSPENAYQACQAASREPVSQGSVGAGTGATVGKMNGLAKAMKAGIGSASGTLDSGVVVGVLVAANPVGDIIDPSTGRIVAGALEEQGGPLCFADSMHILLKHGTRRILEKGQSTVLGIVATNARFGQSELNFISKMTHDGIARAVKPAHTAFDGDIVFTLSTGELEADVSAVGALAADLMSRAILSSVEHACSLGGIPSLAELTRTPNSDEGDCH